MALKTVTGTLKRTDNTPVAGAIVTAQLSAQAVITGSQEVAPIYIQTKTAADGTFSLSLQANLDLTPTTTSYLVSLGSSFTCTAVVPQTAGPFELSNIMASPPAVSPPAALDSQVVHLALTETITGVKSGPFYDTGAAVINVGAAKYLAIGTWDRVAGTGDAGPAIQQAVNDLPTAGGTVFFPPGTYVVNTSVVVKSKQAYVAAKGTVTLARTVTGDIFIKTSGGGVDQVSFIGLVFDMRNLGWSAIDLIGSDASGQMTNILIRDCYFKNPSSYWLVQIQYTIVDPSIPTSQNSQIRMQDCFLDQTGQTGTLEGAIFINCIDVVVSGCRFLNDPAVTNGALAIYGYCRDVRVSDCEFVNFSNYATYVQSSDSVAWRSNSFRTTASVTCIAIRNSKDIAITDNQMVTGAAGNGVYIQDGATSTFDGHTGTITQSSRIKIQNNRMDAMASCVVLTFANVAGQSDIFIDNNFVSPLRNFFLSQNMPAAPAATTKRIFIRGNHVISHSAISPNNCIDFGGNAAAPNGGLQTLVVTGNLIAASGSSGGDVSVQNLADDVLVQGNRLMSATPISIPAACTSVRVFDNPGSDAGIGGIQIVAATSPLNGQTAAVASIAAATAPNDGPTHLYRVGGAITIVTLGSGVINLQVAYTDQSFTARTCNIPLCPSAGGTFGAAANTADDWKGEVWLRVNPNTSITLKTAGTFTGCTYDVCGSIERIA